MLKYGVGQYIISYGKKPKLILLAPWRNILRISGPNFCVCGCVGVGVGVGVGVCVCWGRRGNISIPPPSNSQDTSWVSSTLTTCTQHQIPQDKSWVLQNRTPPHHSRPLGRREVLQQQYRYAYMHIHAHMGSASWANLCSLHFDRGGTLVMGEGGSQ